MIIWSIISLSILVITAIMFFIWRVISGGLILLWASIVGSGCFFVSVAVLLANIILELIFK